jgi:hypothetical protein
MCEQQSTIAGYAMNKAARYFTYLCAASLCALSAGFANEPSLPRSSRLDGIAIGRTSTPDPLRYFDLTHDYQRAIELVGQGVPGNAEYWRAVSEASGDQTKSSLDTFTHLIDIDRYGHCRFEQRLAKQL